MNIDTKGGMQLYECNGINKMGKSLSKTVMEEEAKYVIIKEDLGRMNEQWPAQSSINWDFQLEP